jgi:hypothetical protein
MSKRESQALMLLGPLLVCLACRTGDADKDNDTSPPGSAGRNPTAEINLDRLPLGDGKYSNSPQKSYVFTCRADYNGSGVGATAAGPWIDLVNKTYSRLKKIVVQGTVSWLNMTSITDEQSLRIIVSNGLPSHATGQYPIATNDPAFRYDPNPNALKPQNFRLSVPRLPQVAASPSCLPQGPIGMMLNGIILFHAIDEQGRDAPAHEVQDACQGHPEPSGSYHYHTASSCAAAGGDQAGQHSPLIGYALDGFGIYGRQGEDGRVLRNSDLDDCHGHTHSIDWDGVTTRLYHYHATDEFPYTIGCLRGQPVTLEGYSPQVGGTAGPRPPRR